MRQISRTYTTGSQALFGFVVSEEKGFQEKRDSFY